jgi:16S rRNA (cytidine1402-2'-O)-methyltransferase
VAGTLRVVATPIGALADLSPRAVQALAEADLVAAEDTRRTRALLTHHGLSRRLVSCHKFNEARETARLVERLEAGDTVALVSDGGTPSVSDPGARLVAAAHAAGIRVEPIPGPSAAVAALSASGLPADAFHFAGFLPGRAGPRARLLERLAALPETLVVYEAPHRVRALLTELRDALGDREAVLCREMTKLHEEIRRGRLSDLSASLEAREAVKGEIVLVVAGRAGGAGERLEPAERARLAARFRVALDEEEGDPRRAAKRLARSEGVRRAEIVRRLEAAGLWEP